MKNILYLFLLFILLSGVSFSQENPVIDSLCSKYGVSVYLNKKSVMVDIRNNPYVLATEPRFINGSAFGATFGLFYELPVARRLSFSIRGLYSYNNLAVFSSFPSTDIINGKSIPDVVEHKYLKVMSNVIMEPTVNFRFIKNLILSVGFLGELNLNKSLVHQINLIQPATGNFDNGSRQKLINYNNMPTSSLTNFSFSTGISYEFPIDAYGKIFLSPELIYNFGFSNTKEGNTWDINSTWDINTIRLGFTLKFGTSPSKIPPIEYFKDYKQNISSKKIEIADISDPIEVEGKAYIHLDTVKEGRKFYITENLTRVDTIFQPAMKIVEVKLLPKINYADSVKFNITSIVDDKEIPLDTLNIEEFRSTDMKPLLNYIFFDDGSSRLPDRYKQFIPSETKIFNMNSLYKLSSLETYYQMLNIVGSRMLSNPNAKLTLTGCNSDIGDEKNSIELSKERANTINNYLVNIWDINPDRIVIKSRNLPQNPSNNNDTAGIAENRRVEITSDSPEILSPIISNDIYYKSVPAQISMNNNANKYFKINEWMIGFVLKSDTIKCFRGTDSIPSKFPINLNEEKSILSGIGKGTKYFIQFSTDSESVKKESPLNLNKITINAKKLEKKTDKKIDNYRLILFDFNKSTLSPENKNIINYINENISDKSKVFVDGYADIIGNEEYNLNLSKARAKSVADIIKSKEIINTGMGKSVLLFDNNLPEGRFYCRTVEVRVETPVER